MVSDTALVDQGPAEEHSHGSHHARGCRGRARHRRRARVRPERVGRRRVRRRVPRVDPGRPRWVGLGTRSAAPSSSTSEAILAIAEAAQSGTAWSTSDAFDAVDAFDDETAANNTPLDYDGRGRDGRAATLTPGKAAKWIVNVALPLGLDPTELPRHGREPRDEDGRHPVRTAASTPGSTSTARPTPRWRRSCSTGRCRRRPSRTSSTPRTRTAVGRSTATRRPTPTPTPPRSRSRR